MPPSLFSSTFTLDEDSPHKTLSPQDLKTELHSKDLQITALEAQLSSQAQQLSTITANTTTLNLQSQLLALTNKLLQHHKAANAQLIEENDQLREEARTAREMARVTAEMMQLQREEMVRVNLEWSERWEEMSERVTGLVVENEEVRGRLVEGLKRKRERKGAECEEEGEERTVKRVRRG